MSKSIPTVAQLQKPLLLVLGELTNWKPDVFVSHKKVKVSVIQHLGFDPNKLDTYGDPANGWCLNGGHSNCKSFGRRIWCSFRQSYYKKQEPLTRTGPKRGQWALTSFGVEKALSLKTNKMNLTAQFIERRIKKTGGINGKFWGLLRYTVSKKFYKSVENGELDDHIQTCMMRLIYRDALKNKILNNINITDNHIAAYLVNSTTNDYRYNSTKPLTRMLYGAKTNKERTTNYVPRDSAQVSHIIKENEDSDFYGSMSDVMDNDDFNKGANRNDYYVIMNVLKETVKSYFPDDWETHLQFIDLYSKKHTLKDIRNMMGLSFNKIQYYIKAMKYCTAEVWDTGVLDGIMEKPDDYNKGHVDNKYTTFVKVSPDTEMDLTDIVI